MKFSTGCVYKAAVSQIGGSQQPVKDSVLAPQGVGAEQWPHQNLKQFWFQVLQIRDAQPVITCTFNWTEKQPHRYEEGEIWRYEEIWRRNCKWKSFRFEVWLFLFFQLCYLIVQMYSVSTKLDLACADVQNPVVLGVQYVESWVVFLIQPSHLRGAIW